MHRSTYTYIGEYIVLEFYTYIVRYIVHIANVVVRINEYNKQQTSAGPSVSVTRGDH